MESKIRSIERQSLSQLEVSKNPSRYRAEIVTQTGYLSRSNTERREVAILIRGLIKMEPIYKSWA